MPTDKDELIHFLMKTNQEQKETIEHLQNTITDLQSMVANLNETIDELKRKLFGTSSEKTKGTSREDEETGRQKEKTTVAGYTRTRKNKSKRNDLYASLPVETVYCDVPREQRLCPDCDTPMEHLGYTFVREELRITPAKVVRVQYMQEKTVCPVCKKEDDTTIAAAKTPTPLLAHSPASPDMVAMVMYQKVFLDLPFYRQSKDWKEKGYDSQSYTNTNTKYK